MATNWTAPTGADLALVLNWSLILKANQNLADDAANADQARVDLDAANRRNELVAMAVEEVRGAIRSGGRYPLAVTAGTIPPEGKRHVLNLAAWQLINSTPNLNMAILTEKGVSMPFAQFYQDAKAWLAGRVKGGSITRPTDPTGIDYTTAVSDSNPAISGVEWSDLYGTAEQYAAGEVVNSDGSSYDLPVDNMVVTS